MDEFAKATEPLIVTSTRCGVAFSMRLVIAAVEYESAQSTQGSAELLLTPEAAEALIHGLQTALARLQGSN